jgi:hypothetical protein
MTPAWNLGTRSSKHFVTEPIIRVFRPLLYMQWFTSDRLCFASHHRKETFVISSFGLPHNEAWGIFIVHPCP